MDYMTHKDNGQEADPQAGHKPVFGQIKQARGFRQFLLRGLEKVRGEWALIGMTHNILKFHKIICSG